MERRSRKRGLRNLGTRWKAGGGGVVETLNLRVVWAKLVRGHFLLGRILGRRWKTGGVGSQGCRVKHSPALQMPSQGNWVIELFQ